MLYKMGEVFIPLITEMVLMQRQLLLRPRVVVRKSSFRRLREKIAPKSVPHVQHDFFSLIQPIISMMCGVVLSVAVIFSLTPFQCKKSLWNSSWSFVFLMRDKRSTLTPSSAFHSYQQDHFFCRVSPASSNQSHPRLRRSATTKPPVMSTMLSKRRLHAFNKKQTKKIEIVNNKYK